MSLAIFKNGLINKSVGWTYYFVHMHNTIIILILTEIVWTSETDHVFYIKAQKCQLYRYMVALAGIDINIPRL